LGFSVSLLVTVVGASILLLRQIVAEPFVSSSSGASFAMSEPPEELLSVRYPTSDLGPLPFRLRPPPAAP